MAKKTIRPLRSEKDYDAALAEIDRYFVKPPKRGTADADRFDLLALVIEDYERKFWPIDPPSPVDAIRYRMDTGGYTQSDLGRLLGSRQRASDVLSPQARPDHADGVEAASRMGHPRRSANPATQVGQAAHSPRGRRVKAARYVRSPSSARGRIARNTIKARALSAAMPQNAVIHPAAAFALWKSSVQPTASGPIKPPR